MQYGKFEIQLGGQMTNTIIRDYMTPAEVEIMRVMHGPESIHPIHITETKRGVTNEDEVERLRARFKSKNSQAAFNSLYPGAYPKLPSLFSEIGLSKMEKLEDKEAEEMVESGMTPEQAKAVIASQSKKVSEEEKAIKKEEEKKRKEEDAKKSKGQKSKKHQPKKGAEFEEEIEVDYS